MLSLYPLRLWRFSPKARLIVFFLTNLWLGNFLGFIPKKSLGLGVKKTPHWNPIFWVVSAMHLCYLLAVRPWLHGQCRFEPTCSVYCVQAFRTHNPFRAIILVLWRLARCHPWGYHAQDPVPPISFPSS